MTILLQQSNNTWLVASQSIPKIISNPLNGKQIKSTTKVRFWNTNLQFKQMWVVRILSLAGVVTDSV